MSLRRAAWAYNSHIFETSAALIWIIVGAAFLTDPRRTGLHSSLAHHVGWIAWTWSLLYIIGGILVIHGLLVVDDFAPRVAGLILLATGTCLQGLAGIFYGPELRTANFFIYATAFGLKAWIVLKVVSRAKPAPK